jgi:hypothetical protein
MFRLSRFMEALHDNPPVAPAKKPPGPVVIWNLIRRCNLNCLHCYSTSADVDFKGELSTAEALAVLEQLRAAHVPALILSGGDLGADGRGGRAFLCRRMCTAMAPITVATAQSKRALPCAP